MLGLEVLTIKIGCIDHPRGFGFFSHQAFGPFFWDAAGGMPT